MAACLGCAAECRICHGLHGVWHPHGQAGPGDLEALYGDTLGPAGSDGATYLQMIEHNTKTIVSNLANT